MEHNENEVIEKALAFAVAKHAGQSRKNGEPYIWHLIRVTEMLKADGFGPEYQVSALLHDVLEDTETSEEEIATMFGDEVLRIVQLLTKHTGDDLQLYIDRILADPIAREVKNVDRLNNLWDCVYTGETGELYSVSAMDFMRRYLEQTKMYFRGRFSKALDESITWADRLVGSKKVPNKFPWYTCSVRTYSKGESPVEIKAKEESERVYLDRLPEGDLSFVAIPGYDGDCMFLCLRKSGDKIWSETMWQLSEKGWFLTQHDIFEESEGAYTLTEEEVLEKLAEYESDGKYIGYSKFIISSDSK